MRFYTTPKLPSEHAYAHMFVWARVLGEEEEDKRQGTKYRKKVLFVAYSWNFVLKSFTGMM